MVVVVVVVVELALHPALHMLQAALHVLQAALHVLHAVLHERHVLRYAPPPQRVGRMGGLRARGCQMVDGR